MKLADALEVNYYKTKIKPKIIISLKYFVFHVEHYSF